MANAAVFAAIAAAGVALILAAVSLISYQRLRSPRALLIGLAFLVFTLEGIYLVVEAVRLRGQEDWILWVSAFDLATLVLLYLAVRKR